MKTFAIRENDHFFASVKARTAKSALNKAERMYKRRSADYNGYKGPIVWDAFGADDTSPAASKTVLVR